MSEKILEVKDLNISFKTDNGLVKAVRGVSFDLEKGETLCIVGESGSGKSVTSKAIMGILANNAVVENGEIIYQGENLLEVSEEEFHKIRGNKIGMIFQDPLSSLNPIVRIGKQITEATIINGNKLKRMFDEVISDDLTKYKNAKTKMNVHIEKAKDTLNKELAKASEDKNSEAKKEAKAKFKSARALAQSEYKAAAPELKKKLNASKKVAREKVRSYKSEVNAAHKAKMKELRASLVSQRLTYLNKAGIEIPHTLNQAAFAFLDYFKKAFDLDKGKKYDAFIEKHKAKELKYQEDNKERLAMVSLIHDEKESYTAKLKITKKEAKKKALEIMKEVGIPFPEKRYNQYPFEFSGGMRQRIVIAIALTATPEILICDEPTTALDVTIQAQILELIKKIQAERNIACIFITHDLGVVANMADRVAVMYAGKIVEYGTVNEIFFEPKHPYTWALLSSIPDVDSKERLEAIPGTPPNMIYPPKGDAFALRSKYAMEIDFEAQPPFFKVSDTHYAATWLLHPDAPKVEMPKIVSQRIKNALNKEKEVASNE